MYIMYGIAGGCVVFNFFRIGYQWTLRTATGWEDPDTHEFKQKQIDEFLEKNKDAEVIQLGEGENYF